MATTLSQDEIDKRLQSLSVEWLQTGDSLERTFDFEDFASALKFVNRVGTLAEEENHHPDIRLSWGKVTLSIMTHDAGGITDKDFALAGKIDQLAQ